MFEYLILTFQTCLIYVKKWKKYEQYSQAWANDHLRIATTCLQRPKFLSHIWNFYYMNDLWTTTTFSGPKGLTVSSTFLTLNGGVTKLFSTSIFHWTWRRDFFVQWFPIFSGARNTLNILVLREAQNIDLYRDWRTTRDNLADHLWSAEQTLGITVLVYWISIHLIRKNSLLAQVKRSPRSIRRIDRLQSILSWLGVNPIKLYTMFDIIF